MTARYRRRSLLFTVHGEEPASIGPAVDGGKQRRIGSDQASQLDRRRGRRARQQDIRHAHPLEIRTMLRRRRPDRLAAAIALEIERDGQPAAVEPDEGLVVGREDGRVGKVLYDREQLSEVGGNRARLRIPPTPAKTS